MSKLSYHLRRLVVMVFLLFAIASALFLLFRILPGSFLDIVARSGATPSELEQVSRKWGLDQPIYVQYVSYLRNMLSGDMGTSFIHNRPVLDVTVEHMINSLVLTVPAITVGYLLGSVFGAILGNSRGTWLEKYGVFLPMVFGTIPEFFLGILLLMVFSGILGLFPTSGMISSRTLALQGDATALGLLTTPDFWWHYTLPFATIALRYLYRPSLIMRTSVVEVSGQDFMYFHRIKGLPSDVRLRHLMRHASLPVVTLFPLSMTRAIGGMVVVEVVFNWPGIGSLLVNSVLNRDYPVIQFVFFAVAVWVVASNYVIDVLYSYLDPRITLEGADEGH